MDLPHTGAIVFLIGDRAILSFCQVEFVTAEIESITLAVILMGIGAILKLAIGDQIGKRNK